MIDELTIYNLSVKYPNTIDLAREVEKMARADAFNDVAKAMYHQCFECDNGNMQKWDTGSWIRYKLFESVLEQLKEQRNDN